MAEPTIEQLRLLMFSDSAPLLQPSGEAPHWPRDKFHANPMERGKSRRPLPHTEFSRPWADIDAKLEVAGAPPLGLLEFHAARLYTGPMFVKYNGTLRGLPGKVPMLTKQFESICQGNTYTTT